MNLKKQLKTATLSSQEKVDIKNNVAVFMSSHNVVRKGPIARHIYWEHKNIFLLIFNSKPMIASIIAAILLAFSGGAAVAAENTVPGDLLYPIKTNITEEVRSALSLSSKSKAAWDTKLAERRLEETEKLAAENKLTTSTAQMLTEKFKEFSDKASARLEKLQSSGKLTEDQVQSLKENFETAISAHNEALSRIQERVANRAGLVSILDSLREQASSTIKDRVEHELELIEQNTTTTLKKIAENRKNAASNKISEVEKFINNNSDKVSAENKAEAIKKLGEAKTKIASGDKLLSEEKYGEAIIVYSGAHRQAQEAQKYLTMSFRLERHLDQANTSTIFASGTLKFNDDNKQKLWDTRENLKNIEQRIREEIKQTRESLRETRKQEMEKVKELIKKNESSEDEDNEKTQSTTTP